MKIGHARQTHAFGFEDDPEVEIVWDNTNAMRLQKILMGRIDGGFFYPGRCCVEMAMDQLEMGKAQRNVIKIHQLPVHQNSVRMAFAKNMMKKPLLERINGAILSMKKDGFIADAVRQTRLNFLKRDPGSVTP